MKRKLVGGAAILLLIVGALFASSWSAGANLPGNDFEGNDGNIAVNTPGNVDWLTVDDPTVGVDLPTGQTDNSFGQGSKEANVNVTVVTGSIPNSKADLARFGVASQTIDDQTYLQLFWTRANQSGTVNFDFELNKLQQPDLTTAGPKTLVRSPGDLLINYALLGGSQSPTLTVFTWNGTTWADETVLGSSVSEGAISTATLTDPLIGGSVPASRFGEANINLTAAGLIDPDECEGFSSAYVKSRASGINSEIKDFIAPQHVNISNCGTIVIEKVTDPSPDPTDTAFDFTLTGGDSALNEAFSLKNGENFTAAGVQASDGYAAAETVPANWELTSFTCDDGSPVTNIDVSVGETVTCTATNTLQQGALVIHKDRKHAAAEGTDPVPHPGVSFTVSGVADPAVTDDNGVACVDGLLPGDYTVTEQVPAGYHSADAEQPYTVVNGTTCATATALEFHNTPLTDVTVSVNSQVDGGTASTIDCGDGPVATDANGDGSLTLPDLEPGTKVCEIVIDP